MTKKTEQKTHFVMVTFGARNERLKKQFQRLVKQMNQTEAGLARMLIQESIDRRITASK
jgi:hypothetical protein